MIFSPILLAVVSIFSRHVLHFFLHADKIVLEQDRQTGREINNHVDRKLPRWGSGGGLVSENTCGQRQGPGPVFYFTALT